MDNERIEDPAPHFARSRTEDVISLFDPVHQLGVGLVHEPGRYTASPDRTSGQVAVASLDSATRSAANLARARGPIPGTRASAARSRGRAAATARSTSSGSRTYGGTPMRRATSARQADNAAHLAVGADIATCSGSGSDAVPNACRIVPPSRSATAGPTPVTSASVAAVAGGTCASRSRTSGSSGQPPQAVLPASARRRRFTRAATSAETCARDGRRLQRSHPAHRCRVSPK